MFVRRNSDENENGGGRGELIAGAGHEPGPMMLNEEVVTVGRFDESVIVVTLESKLMVEQSVPSAL